MLRVCLTGGISSGKSTASRCFSKFKVPIIDADKITHELFVPDTLCYKKIVAHFGKPILTPQKTINRNKLRELIFSNQQERCWLEKLLHPKVRTIMRQQVSKTHAPYCIMVIPLLFETKFPIKVDRVLVVDAPSSLQIKWALKRDGGNAKQIRAIIKTQASRSLRLQNANDIIKNIGSLKNLAKTVKKLHHFYLSMV